MMRPDLDEFRKEKKNWGLLNWNMYADHVDLAS
uniref:Uncharacterized protein n=1 Tax=Rhizophora mucronata TaxID=61149 RepID=A0A2P2PHV1_RHIMU